jgi:hypothetical protein
VFLSVDVSVPEVVLAPVDNVRELSDEVAPLALRSASEVVAAEPLVVEAPPLAAGAVGVLLTDLFCSAHPIRHMVAKTVHENAAVFI